VFQIQQSDVFSAWLAGLRDPKGKARIVARIESARFGNLGDVKSLGDGVSEMRVHVGPGYRLYFARTGKIVLLLLCGGDKSTQKRDIERARSLRKQLVKE
jgi:putative addiction module killer protein